MALSKNTPLKLMLGNHMDLPVSNVHIYEGGLCFLDANGHVVKVIAAGANKFVGHAYAEKDNSAGAAGGDTVRLRGPLPYRAEVAVTGVSAVTDVGVAVYASDDGTMTLTSTSNTKVGRVTRFIAAGQAEVEFIPFVT